MFIRKLSLPIALACVAMPLAASTPACAQSPDPCNSGLLARCPTASGQGSADPSLLRENSISSALDSASSTADTPAGNSTDPADPMPASPEPTFFAANPKREGVPWEGDWHQAPFSRIGVGADISLLGIGIKAATPLDDYFDLRGLINFFGYTTGRIEADGLNLNADIHMASAGAVIDAYPMKSVWRLSAGLMFFNGNQISTAVNVAPGTSFSLGPDTYYSSTADPVNGSAVLGLHTVKPAPMVSFGFGRFVPHSNRHWSFPAEFGVLYMGAPSLTIADTGAVCTDQAQTMCGDVSDASNPVSQSFNTNLQAKIVQWKKDLNKVQFYPIFSYSVVYSFNIR